MGPSPIGMYRCGLASVLLFLGISFTQGVKSFRFSKYPKKVWTLVISAGALFALDLFVWHRAVIFAGAGLGTILGNTQVFYVALIGILFYKEKPKWILFFSIFLAFLGIYLLVDFQHADTGTYYGWGVAFGLMTGLIYANYIVVMRKIESLNNYIKTEHALTLVSFFAAFFLLPVSVYEGTLRLPEGIEWVWLISLAFVAQVLGWLLITKTLPKTPVSQAGLILNAQPVVAVIAGDLILGEHLNPTQILGALITLAAIYFGTQKRKKIKPIPA